jgi:hypothetical protein
MCRPIFGANSLAERKGLSSSLCYVDLIRQLLLPYLSQAFLHPHWSPLQLREEGPFAIDDSPRWVAAGASARPGLCPRGRLALSIRPPSDHIDTPRVTQIVGFSVAEKRPGQVISGGEFPCLFLRQLYIGRTATRPQSAVWKASLELSLASAGSGGYQETRSIAEKTREFLTTAILDTELDDATC